MSKFRILIIEDEEHIQKLLRINLELEGFEVVTTAYGKEGLSLTQQQHFHLLILDIMLPDISGIDVCERLRLANNPLPILMVSAKDTSSDRIKGLKTGADDYITKPFHLEELLLRVNKLIERTADPSSSQQHIYTFGKNTVDTKSFKANTSKGEFKLSKREIALLKLLIDHKNEVVSRQQILNAVWNYDVFPTSRTIDNYILSFRKYFEKNPKKPKYFKSVRGVGYIFVQE